MSVVAALRPVRDTGPTASGDGLRVTGLRKCYDDVVALGGVDLHVRRGTMLGLVGGNGAGKTTTMRIVLGVLSADAGEVTLDGCPLDPALRRRIGYMPEERGLYAKMRVGAQLEYLCRLHGLGPARARENVMRWLERLGIAHLRYAVVDTLSLGNQQRVQLVAALGHDPDVLVLDEPFAGLDPVAVQVMSDVLRERARDGVPVMFSSHQLALVEELCDEVAILVRGRTVAAGRIDDLRDDGPVRVEVTSRHLETGWSRGVPDAVEVSVDRTGSVVEFPRAEADRLESLLGTLLAAALAHGPVTEFRRVRPALLDLFTEVVSG
jgi:ABC-2 type transport system ATP-binding protein